MGCEKFISEVDRVALRGVFQLNPPWDDSADLCEFFLESFEYQTGKNAIMICEYPHSDNMRKLYLRFGEKTIERQTQKIWCCLCWPMYFATCAVAHDPNWNRNENRMDLAKHIAKSVTQHEV